MWLRTLAGAIATAALGALALASAAAAQTSAPAPDPTRMDLARQIVAASGGEAGYEQQLRIMFGGAAKIVSQSLPPDAAALSLAFQKATEDQLIGLAPQLLAIVDRAYAETLTEKELRDELAWVQSDTGKALVAKLPLVQQRTVELEGPLIAALLPKVMRSAADAACVQARCTAKQREQLTGTVEKALAGPGPAQSG